VKKRYCCVTYCVQAIANCISAAGYDVGEYSALVFAGAMTFEDGMYVSFCHIGAHSGKTMDWLSWWSVFAEVIVKLGNWIRGLIYYFNVDAYMLEISWKNKVIEF